MLEATDITKTYGSGESRNPVLKGISLTIPTGAFTVILGASGSGKSTLLNVLSGLERPEGGSIRLSLEKQGKLLKLTVSNPSLVPLPEENLDRLFERFYRADPSRNSQTGGHGIGLSIAKAIVTAHGGQIHASIAKNNALHITATLPQKQPANIMRSQARKVP